MKQYYAIGDDEWKHYPKHNLASTCTTLETNSFPALLSIHMLQSLREPWLYVLHNQTSNLHWKYLAYKRTFHTSYILRKFHSFTWKGNGIRAMLAFKIVNVSHAKSCLLLFHKTIQLVQMPFPFNQYQCFVHLLSSMEHSWSQCRPMSKAVSYMGFLLTQTGGAIKV